MWVTLNVRRHGPPRRLLSRRQTSSVYGDHLGIAERLDDPKRLKRKPFGLRPPGASTIASEKIVTHVPWGNFQELARGLASASSPNSVFG